MHQEQKTNPWFQTSGQRERKGKTVNPVGMLDCKGKCRLREVLKLLGICIYTIKYAPQFLELHVGLRSTCWNFPWVDACKAIVRNKETLIENQLLPSLI